MKSRFAVRVRFTHTSEWIRELAEQVLPTNAENISVDFLNTVLAESPKWTKGSISTFTVVKPHGALDGMSNAVHQISARLSSGEPTSLIVKLRDVGGSVTAREGGLHEVIFYSELADIAGVDSPPCYFAQFDDSTGRMLIILDHLGSDGNIGTIETYLEVAEVERIVVALAGMHAKWWNSEELAALNHVRTFDQVMERGIKLFDSGHFSGRRFIEQYGEHLHPEIYAVYDTEGTFSSKLQAGFSGNRTLCNYDVAAKNLFLPSDPNQPPQFFDWSLLTRGSIGIELAVVLAYSLRIEDHSRFRSILDTYLNAMQELGINDLDVDTLWNDVRHGFLVRLAAPIALTTRDYPPAHELALELLPRITSAALESDALDLIRD